MLFKSHVESKFVASYNQNEVVVEMYLDDNRLDGRMPPNKCRFCLSLFITPKVGVTKLEHNVLTNQIAYRLKLTGFNKVEVSGSCITVSPSTEEAYQVYDGNSWIEDREAFANDFMQRLYMKFQREESDKLVQEEYSKFQQAQSQASDDFTW